MVGRRVRICLNMSGSKTTIGHVNKENDIGSTPAIIEGSLPGLVLPACVGKDNGTSSLSRTLSTQFCFPWH
jgi:hypothetical protein